MKSSLEIEQMENAGRANEEGMRAGLAVTAAGASENDIASAIMAASIKAGGEYVGMEPFVTSGPRSGIPHTTWRRRRIEPATSPCSKPPPVITAITLRSFARWRSAKSRRSRRTCTKCVPEGWRSRSRSCGPEIPAPMCTMPCRPSSTARLYRRLSQAHRLQHGHFVCAGLGRRQYPEPVPRRRRAA